MTRTLIISAHCGKDRIDQSPALVRRLMNRFEDELAGWERMYLNEEASCYGDVWTAEWDAETFTLSTVIGCGEDEIKAVGFKGCDPVKDLLPALYLIMDASIV